jgi:hypothetical protein
VSGMNTDDVAWVNASLDRVWRELNVLREGLAQLQELAQDPFATDERGGMAQQADYRDENQWRIRVEKNLARIGAKLQHVVDMMNEQELRKRKSGGDRHHEQVIE